MALPKKGSRSITVEGRRYRWQGNLPDYSTAGHIVVEDWETPGQRLRIHFDPWQLTGERAAYVSKAIVRQVIFAGLSRGWRPAAPGPDLQLEREALYPPYDPFFFTGEPERHEQLRTLVLAEPDRIEPRMVYADWLIERGDPRGEFIALQCIDGRTSEQETRLAALQKKHWKYWAAPARPVAERWVFEKGFIDRLEMRGAPQRDSWQELHRWEPVTCFAVFVYSENRLDWLLQGTTREVRLLYLPGPSALDSFLWSPHCNKLRSLHVHSSELGDAWAGRLAEESGLAALTSLSLEGGTITDDGVRALLDSPHLAACDTVALPRADLSGRTLERLRQRGWPVPAGILM